MGSPFPHQFPEKILVCIMILEKITSSISLLFLANRPMPRLDDSITILLNTRFFNRRVPSPIRMQEEREERIQLLTVTLPAMSEIFPTESFSFPGLSYPLMAIASSPVKMLQSEIRILLELVQLIPSLFGR